MGISPLILIAAVILGIIILIKILKKPIKFIFKILINSAIGFILLLIFNYFGSIVNFTLPINEVNVILVGLLGVPGILLLILFNFV